MNGAFEMSHEAMNQEEMKQKMFAKFGWTHGAVLSEELWSIAWCYSFEYDEHTLNSYMIDFDHVRKEVLKAI
jgi:hypothetical protein